MDRGCNRARRWSLGACAVLAALLATAPDASARARLTWAPCDDARGVQCATARLPMDYSAPRGAHVRIAVARVPARDRRHRIGSLVFNFGGPGEGTVDYLRSTAGGSLLRALGRRFDLVAFDPRGVGQSRPAIDCHANQETQGIYSVPFATPFNTSATALLTKARTYVRACLAANGAILRHVSTANVARDVDRIRALLGEKRISYLGFSYGTFLGATYAALFPKRYRAMVLDGPVDPDQYVNHPMADLFEQTAGFEAAFGRFMQVCAAHRAACSRFGGADPWRAYDALVARANRRPIPASRYTADPRPVSGDDVITATTFDLYGKAYWGELALALALAAKGDGAGIRALVDASYERGDDGTFSPSSDRYFTIGAAEQRYPRGLRRYIARGELSWATFPHFWSNAGYVELDYGQWPAHDRDAFRGPFRVRRGAATPLVVATTYDPATPYRGALRLVRQLGTARLLTMEGDGHTAYGGNSRCVDAAVNAYLLAGRLPAAGTVCRQHVPFTAPGASAATASAARPRLGMR